MTWTPPIWITLPGLRRYAVSDSGRVRNGQRELETQLNDEGYPKTKLVGDDGIRKTRSSRNCSTCSPQHSLRRRRSCAPLSRCRRAPRRNCLRTTR